jgi:hypothetical protein
MTMASMVWSDRMSVHMVSGRKSKVLNRDKGGCHGCSGFWDFGCPDNREKQCKAGYPGQ